MQPRFEKVTLHILASCPFLWLAAFYCYMLVVRLHLGHFPKPMFEGSGFDDRLVSEILGFALFGVLLSPVLVAYWLRVRWKVYPRSVLMSATALMVVAVAALVLLHQFDPGRCLEWFYD